MDKEKEEREATCGLFGLRLTGLQKYATSKHFLIVYGLLGTIQAMSFVYFISTITTIERRFKITSKTTGLMLCGNEVSQILLSLFLTYYGGQRNRPLWIGWGVACSALSCFILVLPHFLFGPGEDALALTREYLDHNILLRSNHTTKEAVCLPGRLEDKFCNAEPLSMLPPILIFISQFVLGIGTTLYFSLGQTYLDDNTNKRNTPKLLGFTLALRTMGPALGFFIGYFCLNLYIDPTLHPVITRDDPRWLGAWWLGWLFLGSVMMSFAIFIAMFPKRLPRKKELDVTKSHMVGIDNMNLVIDKENSLNYKVDVQHNNNNNFPTEKRHSSDSSPTLKNFPKALKRLLKNKLLMINNWSGVCYILGTSGYMTYLTKYMEIQFHKTAANASVATGPVAILAMCIGFLISGHVISRYKPRPIYLLGWNVVVGMVYVVGQILFIFISCKDSPLQGYNPLTERLELVNNCNWNCSCESLKYNPVCHQASHTTFYSACHAGCTTVRNIDAATKEYSNCSCITSHLYDNFEINVAGNRYDIISSETVRQGVCETDCGYNFLIFIGISCILHALGSSGKIGNILVNYRCVSNEDKSFAQGLSLLMVSLFSFIPGPIIAGMVIDSTCLIWDNSCGTKGNCKLYERDSFRFRLNALGAGITFIGAALDAVVCYLGKNLELYGEEEKFVSKGESESPEQLKNKTLIMKK